MNSKEEILSPFIEITHPLGSEQVNPDNILKAMDIFAKEMCIDFVDWLLENTEIIKEEKITLFRYHDTRDGWGDYVLNDIHLVYLEELNNS